MRPTSYFLLCVYLCGATAALQADDPLAFRTDDNPDEKLPWFQLVDGEFPPVDSAHYFSGELIGVDHLERSFVLRVDRTDKQNRSHFDLPMEAALLPYGSVYYHGAPASLRDIPIGTHLHGWFHMKHPDDDSKPLAIFHNRLSYEIDFRRCFRLEDDFSFYSRQKQLWHVDSVDLEEQKLTLTLQHDGKAIDKPQTLDLQKSTRVWRDHGFADQQVLSKGQLALFNMTWATLYGPGRLTDIWIDDESRQAATAHQLEKHRIHVRQRGLPGWVDAVDNEQRIVTITFFGGVDPQLFDELLKGQSAGIAVSKETLMTYDPVNDRKSGPILEITRVPAKPGSSGVQIQVQPSLLLEGYRPKRIVRVYAPGWPVVALPREEQFFGR